MTPTFVAPAPPSHLKRWEDLTANERGWLEMIRVISNGTDPAVDPDAVVALRDALDHKRGRSRDAPSVVGAASKRTAGPSRPSRSPPRRPAEAETDPHSLQNGFCRSGGRPDCRR